MTSSKQTKPLEASNLIVSMERYQAIKPDVLSESSPAAEILLENEETGEIFIRPLLIFPDLVHQPKLCCVIDYEKPSLVGFCNLGNWLDVFSLENADISPSFVRNLNSKSLLKSQELIANSLTVLYSVPEQLPIVQYQTFYLHKTKDLATKIINHTFPSLPEHPDSRKLKYLTHGSNLENHDLIPQAMFLHHSPGVIVLWQNVDGQEIVYSYEVYEDAIKLITQTPLEKRKPNNELLFSFVKKLRLPSGHFDLNYDINFVQKMLALTKLSQKAIDF